ncbi:MAG: sugar ABC transporter ATP-binding protein [Bauldia sp.]|nr:sugar ABC transporter ATP-binding protein [Bauldia sp.]
MTQTPPLLEVAGISKQFGDTHALDDVSIAFHAGEVHALLGENGAGKSTLIKILAGVYQADEGEVRWRGSRVDPERERYPIAFIHQDLGLVDEMTVAENIAIVAGYPKRGGLIDWQGVNDLASRTLERIGGDISPDMPVADLSAAAKSIIAIARALSVRADLLVLDEPTAALPEADVSWLMDALHKLRSEGIGIIYVTHRLDEVFRIADRTTVLRDGCKVESTMVADTSPQALVHAIVGRRLEEQHAADAPAVDAETVLKVDALVAEGVGPASFSLARGEILGLVGLRGAGHDVVGRAIFGDVVIEGGSVSLGGRTVALASPRAATRQRIGFVSSKRREESLAASLTVRENLFANPILVGAKPFGPIPRGSERKRAAEVLRRLSVRPPDTERPILVLSGGNQQKVILSRWIEAECRLLVLEEPTIGVDVGSKAEIYSLINTALENGLAVLLVSSDFEEVERVAHRALVFDRGRPIAELSRNEITIARLTETASGEIEETAA